MRPTQAPVAAEPTDPESGPGTTVANATRSLAANEAIRDGSSGNARRDAGSTKTSMVPPQVSPTSMASRSLTP